MPFCEVHQANYLFVCFYCMSAKIARLEGEELGIPAVLKGFEEGATNSIYGEPGPGLTYEKLLDTYRKFKQDYPEPPLRNIVVMDPIMVTVLTRKLKRNRRRKHKRPPSKLFLKRFSKTIPDPSIDTTKAYFDTERGTLYIFGEAYRELMKHVQAGEYFPLPALGIGVREPQSWFPQHPLLWRER